LQELELAAQNPEVWNNPEELKKINQEKAILEKATGQWQNLRTQIDDLLTLIEMAQEASDEDTFAEAKEELPKVVASVEQLEVSTMLSGEMDANSAYLSINSGAGGTEACDWADMLFRMYVRYAERQGFKVSTLERTDGDEAGIKSITLHIEGPFAYGYLRSESGVHRLVRISPFDSNARRHTSFAAVFSWPEVDDSIEIEIKQDDLRVDTYRASGAGGQHVNRTDSAVRMTHIPTGIVVQCQNERSQHANRDQAMKMLRAALYEKEMQERNKEKDEMNASKMANEWGSQIRSYVMHPYQMVKDHRTSHESSQVNHIMDGDLDSFIRAFLEFGAKGNS
jgi:peptide chain release factor 2